MRPKTSPYFAALLLALLGGCATSPLPPSKGHLSQDSAAKTDTAAIPKLVQSDISVPKPRATPKVETYSVVVNNIRAQELLFALARDAKLNVDIHPGIGGFISLNAIDQTLQQLLTRISKQVDMRWELDGPNLIVMPDKPFLKTYKIDFINMARTVKSTNETATQIASGGSGTTGSATSGASSGSGNTASTSITSNTKNDLMESLISNVTDMLREEDKIRYKFQIDAESRISADTEGDGDLSTGSGNKTEYPNGKTETTGAGVSGKGNQSADVRANAKKKIGEYEPSNSVFANKETGVLIVRATSRQHEKVQQFIDEVMAAAKRQVLIEATIVEVSLNDNYKQGVNWSALKLGAKGFTLNQAGTAGLPSDNPLNFFTIDYTNATSRVGNIAAQISLLESFGKVKVLSSPKISVMNNQTATLKVADNKVYFTIKAEIAKGETGRSDTVAYTTTPNTVAVGMVMNVTPEISDADQVTINIRPTITRIVGFVNDPNPTLVAAGVVNRIPEIQTREMESIIKVSSGQIAVMGGLMQDELNNLSDGIPGLSKIPGIGNIFRNRNDTKTKTELIIFLRPTIIRDASVAGDYRNLSSYLPDDKFLENTSDNGNGTNGEKSP